MASAWGKSWGRSFGNAWGQMASVPAPPPNAGARLRGIAFRMPRPRLARARTARERDDLLILFKP